MDFEQSQTASAVLEDLKLLVELGFSQRALQRSPHLVLLNTEWYHAKMRPVMAKWMMLWLEANHVSGLSSEQVEAYILGHVTSGTDDERALGTLSCHAREAAMFGRLPC